MVYTSGFLSGKTFTEVVIKFIMNHIVIYSVSEISVPNI